MSNNILNQSNEPPDAQLDIVIGETEDVDSPAQDVGSPTSEESSPTVDLDEL